MILAPNQQISIRCDLILVKYEFRLANLTFDLVGPNHIDPDEFSVPGSGTRVHEVTLTTHLVLF